MLNAVKYGKAGTVLNADGEPTSLRAIYRASEDLLTASVFERLSYLPARHFIGVLVETFGLDLPFLRDPEIHVEYWPSYPYSGKDRNRVELDLLIGIRDDNGFHREYLVEVKPSDQDVAQDPDQWRREMTAYHEQVCAEGELPANGVVFLALGGMGTNLRQSPAELTPKVRKTHSDIGIRAARWADMLQAVKGLRGRPDCSTTLITDILESMALSGHEDRVLFSTLETQLPKGASDTARRLKSLEALPMP